MEVTLLLRACLSPPTPMRSRLSNLRKWLRPSSPTAVASREIARMVKSQPGVTHLEYISCIDITSLELGSQK